MLIVLLITCLLVLLAVGVHYNALSLLTRFLPRRGAHVRRWVAASILGLLLAHVLEVTIFAVGYAVLESRVTFGALTGAMHHDWSDYWYFSFVAYTSLGFGDITPTGSLRLMTALETLSGLILIAWSASFLFMQMQRSWNGDSMKNER